jgi:hypothetical protein
MDQDDAIVRLARQIDAAKKAEQIVANPATVATVRRRGAADLHRICADFVAAVNAKLVETLLDLAPAEYSPVMFRDPGVNLIQISSQGRQMQISFQAPAELVSTEKFLVPYVLEGEVRAYNQKMLERSEIRSRMVFYCIEKDSGVWRFFDWRTLSTGPVGRDLLTTLIEPLF